MKHIPIHQRPYRFILFFLLLSAMLACQVTSGLNPQKSTPVTSPGSAATQQTRASARTPNAAGGWSLAQPAAGLEDLSSYHQGYVNAAQGTYKGQPYETSTSEDRWVNGADETSLTQATTTGQKPFYLQFTRWEGQNYVQQKEKQACRAQAEAESPDQDLNPAAKLPAVFTAQETGRETISELPVVHYHFSAEGVPYQAGQSGTADGDVWVAEDGGYVVKYQLKVEVKDGDFNGTRTWDYILDGINSGTPVALPDGCLPLLSGLPALPGQADVTSMPGFLSYTSSSSIADAASFFTSQLPAQQWYALPGDAPQADTALLKFARAAADGRGQVLVVQLSAQGQGVEVVMQILNTHQPIPAVTPPVPGAAVTPSSNEATETPEEGSGPALVLPEGLPVYPGAKVLLQNSQALMCQTADALEKVAQFYNEQMAAAGWQAGDSTAMGEIVTQSWTKGDASVIVVLMVQNNLTQIVISPQ